MLRTTVAVRIGVGSSSSPDPRQGARDAARLARAGLASASADLVLMFVAGVHMEHAEASLQAVRSELRPRALAGCAARSVMGGSSELDASASIVVWAANLGMGEASVFHLGAPLGEPVLPECDDRSAVLLFPDPYSYPIAEALPSLLSAADGVPVLGGLSSGRLQNGDAVLFVDDRVMSSGMVCVCLGGTEVVPVVAGASFPVGPELIVTGADRHVVYELSGRPAVDALQSALRTISPEQRRLVDGGVNIGLADGDGGDGWVMRKILRADERDGIIAVGATVETGQVVRLLANSSVVAGRRLRAGLMSCVESLSAPPSGALLFTCVNRDRAFLGHPGFDAATVSEVLGTTASAGYASLGEIGPATGAPGPLALTAVVGVFTS